MCVCACVRACVCVRVTNSPERGGVLGMNDGDSSVLSARCYGEAAGCHGSHWAGLELIGNVMHSLPLPRPRDCLCECVCVCVSVC